MIHLLTGADERFAPGLLVTATSALLAMKRSQAVTIHVMDGGLSKESKDDLHSACLAINPNCSIHWIPTNTAAFGTFRPGLRDSRMYYARLWMGSLISAERVIYLDSDIVVLSDLSLLWERPMGGRISLACGDRSFANLAEDCPWPLDPPERTFPYFNSGFMLVDLEKWRADGLEDKALDLAAGAASYQWHDQTVLNYLLRGKVEIIEQTLNWQAETLPSESLDRLHIHYSTGRKPWSYWGLDSRFRIWRAFYSAAGKDPLRLLLSRGETSGLILGLVEGTIRRNPWVRRLYVSWLSILLQFQDGPQKAAIAGRLAYYSTGLGSPSGDSDIRQHNPVVLAITQRLQNQKSPSEVTR